MREFFNVLTVLAAMAVACGAMASATLAGDDNAAAKKTKGRGKFGNPEQIFKKLDSNGDGKLSKDEFLKIADRAKDPDKAAKLRTVLERAWTSFSVDDAITLEQFKKFQELRRKKKNVADSN